MGRTTSSARRRATNILRAWRDVERFQRVLVPTADQHGHDLVGDLRDASGATWPPAPARTDPRRPLLSTRVYVGCVPIAAVDRWLEAAFAEDERFREAAPRSRGTACRAYFDVDRHGWPVPDSLVVCPLVDFALDVAPRGGAGTAQDAAVREAIRTAGRFAGELTTAYEAVVSAPRDAGGPFGRTTAAAQAITDARRLGWRRWAGDVAQAPTTRFRSQWIADGAEPDPELLESFFIDDLRTAEQGRSPLLASYLAAHPSVRPEGGQDVDDEEVRAALLHPAVLPPAAWPAADPPNPSQQLALTAVLRDRDRTPILGVNGPPGTGKTTLLREVYANLVAERAEALCAFDDPREAFGEPAAVHVDMGAQAGRLRIREPDPSITGWEMLVASSNNAAVENVTKELPVATALAPGQRAETRYFSTAARRLLPDLDAWGLAAGALGRRSNVNEFLFGLGMFERAGGDGTLVSELRAGAREGAWDEARDRFLEARGRVEEAIDGLETASVDAELQALRIGLFQAALDVHEAFARAAGTELEGNLRVWAALARREIAEDDRAEVAPAAWQSLFLVVPMLSTTFASLARLLGDLHGAELGWLVVDEAGQAAPQAVVGGLLRFRHAVVVGDPDQLEPVVTLPRLLLERLMVLHRAPRELAPHRTSVQALADACTAIGTHRAGRWIGLPLRVHHRCAAPMFEIANELAYEDQMVQGRRDAVLVAPFPLGPSRWIEVPHAGDGHWNPADGEVVRALLAAIDPDDPVEIALLSPFRDVVSGLRRVRSEHLDRVRSAEGEDQAERAEAALGVGTVHTFQGRERDAVILVLGGASQGARDWVTATPNLLNVAVTRARDRLYVVGDRERWSGRQVDVLLRHLPAARA